MGDPNDHEDEMTSSALPAPHPLLVEVDLVGDSAAEAVVNALAGLRPEAAPEPSGELAAVLEGRLRPIKGGGGSGRRHLPSAGVTGLSIIALSATTAAALSGVAPFSVTSAPPVAAPTSPAQTVGAVPVTGLGVPGIGERSRSAATPVVHPGPATLPTLSGPLPSPPTAVANAVTTRVSDSTLTPLEDSAGVNSVPTTSHVGTASTGNAAPSNDAVLPGSTQAGATPVGGPSSTPVTPVKPSPSGPSTAGPGTSPPAPGLATAAEAAAKATPARTAVPGRATPTPAPALSGQAGAANRGGAQASSTPPGATPTDGSTTASP